MMKITELNPRMCTAEELHPVGSIKSNLIKGLKPLTGGPEGAIELIAQRIFAQIKHFTSNVPGGWHPITVTIFLNSCKAYLPSIKSVTKTNDMTPWCKIVEKCMEMKTYHPDFSLYSALDLARSLKSYVLNYKNRKEDYNYKAFYEYVAELIQFLPGESNETMNQTLRQQSKSDSSDLALTSDAHEAAKMSVESIDRIVVKCCHDFLNILETPMSKYIWNLMSGMIYERFGMKIDVKKHIYDLKKNIIKETTMITDVKKRASVFTEMVGNYRFIFDYIPPLIVRVKDFSLETSNSNSYVATSRNTTEDNKVKSVKDKVESASHQRKGKKYSTSETENSQVHHVGSISELQRNGTQKRVGRKKQTHSTEDTLESHQKKGQKSRQSETANSEVHQVEPISEMQRNGTQKRGGRKKTHSTKDTLEVQPVKEPPQTLKTKSNKQNTQSDDFEDLGSPIVIKRRRGHPRLTRVAKTYPIGTGNNDLNKKNLVKPINRLQTGQQNTLENQPTSEINENKVNFAPTRPEPSPKSPMPITSQESDINQRSRVTDRLGRSTVKKVIKEYKEKVIKSNTPASILQLLPPSHAGSSSSQSDNSLTILNNTRPPSWFETFVVDYKKHEMWKMNQVLKMQEELVDMENRKITLLEKVLSSLDNN